MTDKITPIEPTEDQLNLMQSYSQITMQAVSLLAQCEPNNMALQHASTRLQESVQWFTTYIMSGGRLKPPAANPVEPPRILTPMGSHMTN